MFLSYVFLGYVFLGYMFLGYVSSTIPFLCKYVTGNVCTRNSGGRHFVPNSAHKYKLGSTSSCQV